MERRTNFFPAVALALLAGAALLVLSTWNGHDPGETGETSIGEPPSGPEIVLKDVEMREFREGEPPHRFLSDTATYRVLTGHLSASGVTVLLQGRKGKMVVRAPEAHWDMRAGRINLPAGGSAEGLGGWTATLASANLSLNDRMLRSAGGARLTGHGLDVEGESLSWRWRDGKMELSQPKTRLVPARTLGRKG